MPTYTYEAKYEPPDGTCLYGLGHWANDNTAFIDTLGGLGLPAVHATNFNVGPSLHPAPTAESVRVRLAGIAAQGAMPDVGIEFVDYELGIKVDDVVATSDTYDHIIEAIVAGVMTFGEPCFIRIGWECNNTALGGYHIDHFATAFRKVVDAFRDAGATNVAFVWGVEATFPPAEWPLWHPGIDYVDWYGVDLFRRDKYLTPGQGPYENLLTFLLLAEADGVPVIMSEVGAVGPDMPNGGTIPVDPLLGDEAFDYWPEPFFDFLEAHPVVKCFCYVTHDHTNDADGILLQWKDARLQHNTTFRARWVGLTNQARYLHSTDLGLLYDPEPPEHDAMATLQLTTLSDVKALMGGAAPTDATQDAVLAQLIKAVSSSIEHHLNRKLLLVERTERHSPLPYARTLSLRAVPVSEEEDIEIKEAADWDFDSVDAEEAEGFFLAPESGLVHLKRQLLGGPGTVRVVYTGGMAATPEALKDSYPHVYQAATFWVKEAFATRNILSQTSSSMQGVSSSFIESIGEMPAIVERLLAPEQLPAL